MARLTNKDRDQLRQVLKHLERASKFIQADRTMIGVRTQVACLPEDTFVNKTNSEEFVRINKQAGSDLCGLSMGIDYLAEFLATH